jgi:hypothetical protein
MGNVDAQFQLKEPDPTDPPLSMTIGLDDQGQFVVSVTLGAMTPTQGAVALLRTAEKLMRVMHPEPAAAEPEPACHFAAILSRAVDSIADLITVHGQEAHS